VIPRVQTAFGSGGRVGLNWRTEGGRIVESARVARYRLRKVDSRAEREWKVLKSNEISIGCLLPFRGIRMAASAHNPTTVRQDRQSSLFSLEMAVSPRGNREAITRYRCLRRALRHLRQDSRRQTCPQCPPLVFYIASTRYTLLLSISRVTSIA